MLLGDGGAGVDDGLSLLGGLEADVTLAVPLQDVHVGHRRDSGEGVLEVREHWRSQSATEPTGDAVHPENMENNSE